MEQSKTPTDRHNDTVHHSHSDNRDNADTTHRDDDDDDDEDEDGYRFRGLNPKRI